MPPLLRRIHPILVLATLVCIPIAAQTAAKARRVALVVGNSAYQYLPPVRVAVPDAEHIASAVDGLAFDVHLVRNADLATLRKDVTSFLNLVQPDDVVLVYFSGYGAQFGGDNFLLPVNYNPDEKRTSPGAYSLTLLLQQLDEKKVAAKIVLTDGSRACPRLGDESGFTRPAETPDRTFAIFSDQFDRSVPVEANATGSVFTKALLDALAKPVTLASIFESVRIQVLRSTSNTQVPVLAMSTIPEEIYLREPPASKPPGGTVAGELKPLTMRELSKDGLNYVWIPPGEFLVGCVPEDRECQADEKPRHSVKLTKGFWIARTETTTVAYDHFVRDTGHAMAKPTSTNKDYRGTQNPITNVSWQDADAYCTWVGGGLPTEAEWEYAARGGKAATIFPWGNSLTHNDANYFGSNKKMRDKWDNEPSPVRSFDANGFQVFDVVGNVREWVSDWYAPEYPAGATHPQGPAAGSERVIRGGDFGASPKFLRLSSREHRAPDLFDNRTGFRCALPAWPEK